MTALSDAFASSGLCPSCFSGTGGAQTCPVCGYTPAGESDWNRLPPGTVLRERYAVGGALGQGGFGVTYLGLDLLLHTRLAIKEYYPSGICARNPESRSVRHASRDLEEDFKKGMEKFLEEARTLARFEDHPNIVSVKDFFEENGTAYMVMNYVEGKTLGEHLKERGGRIPFDEAMGILSPLMDALDEIHASGTIHRDLSPDNIYLTRYGQPKLLDFGASKSALSMMQQRSHSVILKRGYSPPEQYQSRGRLGPWTDVYGMAATLYRCVTGEVPADAMDRMEEDILKPPCESTAQIPGHVDSAIVRALSVSAKNRPQSMEEFRNMLGGSEPRTPPSIPAPQSSFSDTPRMESPSFPPPPEEKPQPERRPPVPKGEKAFSPKLLLALLIPIVAFFLFGDGGRTASTGRSPSQSASQSQSQSANTSTTSSPTDPVLRRAQEGDAEAQAAMGIRYYKGEGVPVNDAKAVEWLRKAADQGHEVAQAGLGWMYHFGRGVEQDDKMAVEWFRKAAAQGHPDAQCNLGWMYANGRGVAQDDKMAVEWYRKAAAQGHAGAQNNLGEMYAIGGADNKMAVEWYWKAAVQGLAAAQGNLGWMYHFSRGVAQDDKMALEWYRKAADQGHADAQFYLGVMYAEGQGVAQDDRMAVEWYRKAADQGHELAQDFLGEMYEKGRGVPQDYAKAEKWFRMSAEQGEGGESAQFSLGFMYFAGQGVPGNYAEAEKWFRKGAEQGEVKAQYNLGVMYEYGRGVAKDMNKAVEWYRKAAAQGHEGAKYSLERLGK